MDPPNISDLFLFAPRSIFGVSFREFPEWLESRNLTDTVEIQDPVFETESNYRLVI